MAAKALGENAEDPPSAGALASGIRSIRQRKRMTVAALAAQAGLNKGYVSRIERGEKAPSISALLRIADALDVGVGHLFGEAAPQDAISVVRASEIVAAADKGKDGEILQAIFPPRSERRLSAFIFEPAAKATPRQADHPGDEVMFVLSGAIEVAFSDRTVQLAEKDSIYFNGHLKHRMRRIGRGKARVLIIIGQDLPQGGG